MRTLPPLPEGVGWLLDAETERLRSITGDSLQRSPDDCRTCHGTKTFIGFADFDIPADRPELAEYACHCADQFQLSRWLLYRNFGANVARRFWADAIKVPADVRDALHEYSVDPVPFADRGLGAFLYSEGFGLGKTLMASLIFKRFIAAGIPGHWITFAQLLDNYTNTFRDKAERAWFDYHIRNARVLVIDDIGKETKGLQGVTNPALDTLLRTRIQNGLATIVTANFPPHEIGERYTPALGSLVTETCLPFEFRSDGADVREWSTGRTLWEVRNNVARPWTV